MADERKGSPIIVEAAQNGYVVRPVVGPQMMSSISEFYVFPTLSALREWLEARWDIGECQ